MALKVLPLVLAALAGASSARAGSTGAQTLRERYFRADWARADAAAPAVPAASGAPVAPPAPSKTGSEQYTQIAHMYITREAFKLFIAAHPGSELARYIGDYDDKTARPSRRDDGNVVAGSFDEDEEYDNPYGQKEPMLRHFWNPYSGLHRGIGVWGSSVDRAYEYMTGGYGVDGSYNKEWDHNSGAKRGVKGHGAVWLYRHGEKAKAFWYLGHVAHLIEDATVPAHVHLFPHVIDWMDNYETYMTQAHVRWPFTSAPPVEHFDTLLDLFRSTALVTARYDCGNGGGLAGVDGTADRGRRRAGGFTKKELDEEGAVLVPLAVSRVAALYQLFYDQVGAPAAPLR